MGILQEGAKLVGVTREVAEDIADDCIRLLFGDLAALMLFDL